MESLNIIKEETKENNKVISNLSSIKEELNVNLDVDDKLVNDIDTQTMLEDEEFVFNIIANDVDGDNLSYWGSTSEYAEIIFIENQISVIPIENWHGEINITINVTDGEYIDTKDFLLEVLPVNDPPVLDTIN